MFFYYINNEVYSESFNQQEAYFKYVVTLGPATAHSFFFCIRQSEILQISWQIIPNFFRVPVICLQLCSNFKTYFEFLTDEYFEQGENFTKFLTDRQEEVSKICPATGPM